MDLDRFLHPRDAARLIASDQPIAHEGKAGWAVERATQRAIWIGGSPQWDVLERAASESGRKRVQIGLKLSYEQADELEDAAELFGVSRTTLARLLVVRGAREIVERAKG